MSRSQRLSGCFCLATALNHIGDALGSRETSVTRQRPFCTRLVGLATRHDRGDGARTAIDDVRALLEGLGEPAEGLLEHRAH